MANFAIVDDATGAVVNVIVANAGDPCPQDGASLVALNDGDPFGIGWTYQNGQWSAPAGSYWVLQDGEWVSDAPPKEVDS